MSLGLLLAVAHATPQPAVGVHAYGLGDVVGEGAAAGAGGGATFGVRAIGPLWVELGVDAGWDAPRVAGDAAPWRVGVAPGLRVFLLPRDERRAVPSLAVRAGADLGDDRVDALFGGDLALDVMVGKRRDWAVRLEVGALTRNLPLAALRGGVGVVWAPHPRPPPPEAPSGVWLPYPRCVWVDRERAHGWLADHRRGVGGVAGAGDTEASAAPPEVEPQGTLFVAASPGDVVAVAGADGQRAAADGVVGWVVPDGRVTVTAVGGGREVERSATVASGYATWVRVPPPEPVRVVFDLGSARIRPEVRERLLALAQASGAWRWRVHGSHSPEGGSEANGRLALERAEAVKAVLVAAGLPLDAVEVGPSEPPEAALRLDQQRSVRCVPLPPAEAP